MSLDTDVKEVYFFDTKIPFVQGQNSTAQYQDWLDKKDRVKGVNV